MKRATKWLLAGGALAAITLLFLDVADARPGGGQGYSGGGGHGGGSSGGGDGGGELLYIIFRILLELIIYKPEIGIPVTIVVIGIAIFVYLHAQHQKRGLTDWDSGPPSVYKGPPPKLDKLKRTDEDFSTVLFDDFVYRLFAAAHEGRGREGGLEALAPYISQSARGTLKLVEPTGVPVAGVIVGAMRVTGVNAPKNSHNNEGVLNYSHVTLQFEACFTAGQPGNERGFFVVESWTLSRGADVLTKPPGKAQEFPCPNCGAPFEQSADQKCSYCDEVVDNGKFDWIVKSVNRTHTAMGGPLLTGTVPERGTDLETYMDSDVGHQWGVLSAEDPALTQDSIQARIFLIFEQLNKSWQELDLAEARPYVSDGMFDYLQYWVTAYKQQGLRNKLDDMKITQWTVCKVISDKYYDAITCRVWAKGKDYTVNDKTGKVVGGSKSMNRPYTEYWTLIRNAETRGEASGKKECPACGADMKINMAGSCEYCGAHLTSGEFDFVLSKIEQDDSYRG